MVVTSLAGSGDFSGYPALVLFRQHAAVITIALGLAAGCAEHLRSIDPGVGWSTGVIFWPPPRATSSWLAEPSPASMPSMPIRDAAAQIGSVLRRAGYADLRWFPIGARYEHGFAVTTRLERIFDNGTSKPANERWLSSYPEAASLRWLVDSPRPYLPAPGRYRVLLIAFSDLHVPYPGRPQRFDEGTAMDGPDWPATAIPAGRRAADGSRVGVYIYEYKAKSRDGEGTFVSEDEDVPAAAHVERSGLSALSTIASGAEGVRSR